MSYRDETEALRARVDHLEEELAVLRGRKRAERDGEDRFASKVRRQAILLVVLAVVGSLAAGLCVGPSFAALFGGPDSETAERIFHARHDRNRRRVRVRARLAERVRPVEPHAFLVADARRPEVLYYCGRSCPSAVSTDLLDAEVAIPERELTGKVQRIGPAGYGATALPAEVLLAYASEIGVPPESLVVIGLDAQTRELAPTIMTALFFASLAVLLWVAVFVHRARARRSVDLPTPADAVPRDPFASTGLSVVTCRLYELYWQYVTTKQLRRITGRPDLLPGLDLVLTLATFGFWSYWIAYRNAEAVDEAMSDRGARTAHRQTAGLLAAGSLACGLCHWCLVYKLQEAYNALIVGRSGDDL